MKPTVALVGRPNVGKSTLFNRILGRKAAIVEDLPGVTRDRNYAETDHAGRALVVVDTGGFEPDSDDEMLVLMASQVEIALAEADAIVLVMDGRAGLTDVDKDIFEKIRRAGRRVYLAVNKIDSPSLMPLLADFYTLGAEHVFPITAEGGSGVAELLEQILEDTDAPPITPPEADEGLGPCRLTIVGRPNVGKSTLSNAIIGHERFLTSDVAGTTRDSIDSSFTANGRQYILVDTAGVRRRKRVESGVERMSVGRAMQAIDRAHVVALVFDATEGLTDQDKKLASLITDRGRGLVLVANKWDLMAGKESAEVFTKRIRNEASFLSFAPLILLSAKTGKSTQRVLPTVDRVYTNLFRRITTSELNRFYEQVIQTHPPHTTGTKTVRIKYLMQVDVNPPVILLYRGGTGLIPDSYLRFLTREIRKRWDYEGVSLVLAPKGAR